jgi:hypothetical protein
MPRFIFTLPTKLTRARAQQRGRRRCSGRWSVAPFDRELGMETKMPTVRVSVMRCNPRHFAEFKKMMAESIAVLEPGIRQMRGLIHFYTGEDEASNALAQVSVWRTLEDAKQLDTFQPMLDLGKLFSSKGATFERPIMNYVSLWEIAPEP